MGYNKEIESDAKQLEPYISIIICYIITIKINNKKTQGVNYLKNLRFNGYQIKLFMAFLMVFDHLQYIPGLLSQELIAVFHVLTRVVGVWFAYISVEGFLYTRNIKKYITRLFSWALLMFVGNTLINFVFQSKGIAIHNNIFLTLATGVLLLYCIKNLENKVLKYLSAIIILAVGLVATEGGMTILPFMLITYFTYGKNRYRNLGYIILSFILFYMSFVDYGDIATTINMLAYNSDFLFILVLPFLYLYNGKRGNNSDFAKYFFYVFYPLHLWIIAIIAWVVA